MLATRLVFALVALTFVSSSEEETGQRTGHQASESPRYGGKTDHLTATVESACVADDNLRIALQMKNHTSCDIWVVDAPSVLEYAWVVDDSWWDVERALTTKRARLRIWLEGARAEPGPPNILIEAWYIAEYRRLEPGACARRVIEFPLRLTNRGWFDGEPDPRRQRKKTFDWAVADGMPFVLSIGYLTNAVMDSGPSYRAGTPRMLESGSVCRVGAPWARDNFEMRVMVHGCVDLDVSGASSPDGDDRAPANKEGIIHE